MKTEFCDMLEKTFVDKEILEWADGKTWKEFYETCPRGGWLLKLFKRRNGDKRLLTLAKGHCAGTVIHLMDDVSIQAVKAAIDYGNNLIGDDELRLARKAVKDEMDEYDSDVILAEQSLFMAEDEAGYYSRLQSHEFDVNAFTEAFDGVKDSHASAQARKEAAEAALAAATLSSNSADEDAYAAEGAAAAAWYIDSPADSARQRNRQQTADICRKFLPMAAFNVKTP